MGPKNRSSLFHIPPASFYMGIHTLWFDVILYRNQELEEKKDKYHKDIFPKALENKYIISIWLFNHMRSIKKEIDESDNKSLI